MIPRLETVLDAYAFVARRNGELARYARRRVVAALDEAAALSGGREADEPAALFYGFARHDRAFPPALWNAFVERLAVGSAHALGLGLKPDVDPFDLAYLCLDVAEGKVPYEGVRAWFATHLVPVPPRPCPPRE